MRWATITNEAGNGLHVTAAHPWQFSIVPFADSNIDASTHINQLKRSGTVTVHLDAEQAGVGTATCGPGCIASVPRSGREDNVRVCYPANKITDCCKLYSYYKKSWREKFPGIFFMAIFLISYVEHSRIIHDTIPVKLGPYYNKQKNAATFSNN